MYSAAPKAARRPSYRSGAKKPHSSRHAEYIARQFAERKPGTMPGAGGGADYAEAGRKLLARVGVADAVAASMEYSGSNAIYKAASGATLHVGNAACAASREKLDAIQCTRIVYCQDSGEGRMKFRQPSGAFGKERETDSGAGQSECGWRERRGVGARPRTSFSQNRRRGSLVRRGRQEPPCLRSVLCVLDLFYTEPPPAGTRGGRVRALCAGSSRDSVERLRGETPPRSRQLGIGSAEQLVVDHRHLQPLLAPVPSRSSLSRRCRSPEP